ncbi:MAG: PAS domain-containing protein [Pseudomonas sp.]|uniref:PAS domain S-box protein n=1 Tax=Pseudomonas sp. TaxID=306 RepID=UPI0033980E41
MRASELISLLHQYTPDTDIPVSFTDSAFSSPPGLQVASCYSDQSTRCYQNIVELAQDGLLVIDPMGRITYMNPFMLQMTGYQMEEVIGQPVGRLLSTELSEAALCQPLPGDTATRHSLRILSKQGRIYWVQMTATSIPSADSQPRGSMLSITDLTHRQVHVDKVQDQEHLGTKVERITTQLDSLKALRVNLLDEYQALETCPRVAATPYWHLQRYLYLIRPQREGKRIREYIGSQPERINDALAAVRREQRFQEVSRELQQIEGQIRTATFKLDSFLWELAQVPPNLHKLVS